MSDRKIPAPAYIIIGAAMILMSVFIDLEKLTLFVLVGAVFIVIGFFKILMKEKKSAEYHAMRRADQQKQAHHASHANQQAAHRQPQHAQQAHHPAAQHPAQHVSHAQHPQHLHTSQSTTVRCSSCGVKVHPLFKWCPNCGQKLK